MVPVKNSKSVLLMIIYFQNYSKFMFGTNNYELTSNYKQIFDFFIYNISSNEIVSCENTLWEEKSEMPIINQTLKFQVCIK